jgi:protein tyrosine phosphatase (PTP) superfamily phosphohydrolase (DUF442 family)
VDAVNTYRVAERLWSSGQLSADDIRQLPALGVVAVVNLALPTSPDALPEEAALVTGLGLSYVQIPVEWQAPRLAQFVEFAGIMRAYEGQVVWVHCAKNMRVSAFLHLYRKLVLGEADAASRFPMTEIWQPDATWRAFIDRVELHYTNGTR